MQEDVTAEPGFHGAAKTIGYWRVAGPWGDPAQLWELQLEGPAGGLQEVHNSTYERKNQLEYLTLFI